MNFYLVGGAIRDRLLGFEPEERDWVVVGATPEELAALGFRRLDAEFPVFAHPESGEEYALARRERKTGPGHKGFVVEFAPDVTLEEDLLRRDLRLNAIAESETGRLIDPYEGRADIESRILRHVSPAFVEDPLRVLRAARFAARFESLGFSIHPTTLELMRAMSSGNEMRALSPARIWSETEKALATDDPARYFAILTECGALKNLLPESGGEVSTPGPESVIPGSVLAALRAAAALDGRSEVRFAALSAAIGRSCDAASIDRICARYPVPKRYSDLARASLHLVSDLASSGTPPQADRLLTALEHADAFRRVDRFEDSLQVCRALDAASEAPTKGKIDALERSFAASRAVSGAELSRAGLGGRDLARELNRLRLIAIKKSLATNTKSRK
ncbi:MAG TPA: multifunctional CCA tRNA nucleotidyl transferase/2'3'-cyclic phosphodiesterase/2'nucleotidase/phosphatase [Gammaproteobacteria bacterium]|nr:multifunctional CCA tRNA nucleotidyl transferase/2'3'-cyclic phosphodiesterase/2'nucleotidase/phosphatase [Gammaproteobacteria bacterium]